MIDTIIEALIDTLKLLPYLLITFLLLEFIEHKFSEKNQKILVNNKKYGTVVGGILGALPQCGFSSMCANLFSAGIITMGTLIAVFLSTSDEMLPIMISEKINIMILIRIIAFKVIVGIITGFFVDLIYKKKQDKKEEKIKEICEHDHCSCDHDGILISSVKHTLKISLFILIANLVINFLFFKVGENTVSKLLLHSNTLTYFISSLVGLIPNCAGSVIITKLYLANMISIGTMLAGLLTGSGLGILLLFKTNKNLKENLIILSVIYFIGTFIGILVDLII